MGKGNRHSGIDIVGEVPWGTHLCQFYQTRTDLLDILVPYFKAGLENNESCMWVTSEPLTERQARAAMRKAMPDFDRYLKRGQIEILPYTQWYLKDGTFNTQRVLDSWVDKLNQALAQGYDGLRLTGNTFWLEKELWKDFTDYEAAIDSVIGNYRMIALCTYCLDRCNATEIIDVVTNHRFAIIRREQQWELIESAHQKRAENGLRRSEERFEAVFAESPIGIELYDSQGRLLNANRACLDLFGVSDVAAVKGFSLFDDPNLSDEAKSKLRRGETARYEGAFDFQRVRELGLYKTTKSGTAYLDVLMTPLSPSEKGYASGYLVQVQDVTGRKLADEARERLLTQLHDERQRAEDLAKTIKEDRGVLYSIMENTEAHLAYLDPEFNFIMVNSTYAKGSGYSADELIGKDHFALFPHAENQAIFEKVRDTGEPIEFHDKPFVFEDQPWRGVTYWDWTLAPVKDASGQVRGLVLSLVDTTERKRMEDRLRDSEAELSAILQNAPTLMLLVDRDRRVLKANRAMLEFAGRSAEETIGLRAGEAFRCMHSLDDPRGCGYGPFCERCTARRTVLDTFETGHSHYQVECKLDFASEEGQRQLTLLLSTVLLDPQQQEKMLVCIQDITQRKRMEEKLRQSEERYRRIVETANEGIWITDARERTVLVNSKMAQMLGYTVEEMQGRSLFALARKEDLVPLFVRWQTSQRGVADQYDIRLSRKDGTEIWAIVSGAAVLDDQGRYAGRLSMLADITERKLLEAELAHSEASYRTLVEASPDGIVSADMEGTVVDCNEGLCQMLGYTKEEIVGKDARELLPSATREEIASLQAHLRQGKILEKEFQVKRSDGQAMPVWAKAVLSRNPRDDSLVTIGYVRDITERKRLDELKDEFIGLVSHELRTPLTVIKGAINTVLEEEGRLSEDDVRQLLQDAAFETDVLNNLLWNLLELSRAQAKRLVLTTAPVNVEAMAKDCIAKVGKEAPVHQFAMDFPKDFPVVNADPIRIERILHNLLENALKFSPQGGEIRVFGRREGDCVLIGVNDQGIGIPSHIQARLFKPFERLDSYRPEQAKGTGLGLVVCQRLVEAHGGRIWVESAPERGSTFYFTLPRQST